MIKHFMAWDLGATKCSAGIIEFDTETRHLICKNQIAIKLTEAESLADLHAQVESGLNTRIAETDAVCIGAAGQFNGEQLILEGIYPYPMHFANLAKENRWPSYAVIHDYAPIVCATFTNYMNDTNNIKRLNDQTMDVFGRRVALGIGTGLGLKDGVLLENGDFWLGRNEIGHIGVSSPPLANTYQQSRHREIMHFLCHELALQQHHPLTFEKILSGQGTVRLYQFFQRDAKDITPEEVGNKMCQGEANDMLNAFAWYMGLFVGTVELTFMPEGGTWITGGVALKNLHVFDNPEFFDGIRASPAYLPQRETYPLGVLCNQEHALIGSGYYAAKMLA